MAARHHRGHRGRDLGLGLHHRPGGDHSALIDPGGALLYNPLVLALGRDVRPHQIELLLCSHQDPDIIGSVDQNTSAGAAKP